MKISLTSVSVGLIVVSPEDPEGTQLLLEPNAGYPRSMPDNVPLPINESNGWEGRAWQRYITKSDIREGKS